MPNNKIDSHFLDSSKLIKQSLSILRQPIFKSAQLITQTFKSGGKLLICGNGGSAAEAQHFASELEGRYLVERNPLPALSLVTNTSSLTAIGNDHHFNEVFSRQLQAYARPGDILIGISTSGNSINVIAAASLARNLGLKVIGLTGHIGGQLNPLCNINLIVPSKHTPLIQEVHLVVIHTICDLVESSI